MAWEHALPGVLRVPQDQWKDSHDDHAEHWGVMDNGVPIASARMCVHEDIEDAPDGHAVAPYRDLLMTPFASFNRLVVAPAFRGQGLAARFDAVRIARAKELACNAVIVATHGRRRSALTSMGFRGLGAVRYPMGHPLHALENSEELFLLELRAA